MTNMKKILTFSTFSLALSASASGAAAGSLAQPQAEASLRPPAPAPIPSSAALDWTGFYTGLQFGYADADGSGGLEGNNGSFGFHAGYDYDFGRYVLGGEIDYDRTDIDLNAGAASIDSVARLKLKGGYDLGDTLIYATAGLARADTSVGDESGPFAGIGVSYRLNDRYSLGAELLEHRFDDVGGIAGNDVDATTLTLRGALRF